MILEMGCDESLVILPQPGIARINVCSPDLTGYENSIDLRDELQQVIIRTGLAESPVVLLALFVKVQVTSDEETRWLPVESQIRTDDDAYVVQVALLNRMDRPHFLERVARRDPVGRGAVPVESCRANFYFERVLIPFDLPLPCVASHYA